MIKSIYEEALEKAWDLVHNKYPENNEEIQLVRYAIKTAMELTKRIGELESKLINQEKLLELYKEFFRLSNIPRTAISIYVFNSLLEIKNKIKELENK